VVLVRTRCLRPPRRATGWRCWTASWVETPYDPGQDEVSASRSQRCDVGDVGAVAPPLHADGLPSLLSLRLRRHIDNLLSIRAPQAPSKGSSASARVVVEPAEPMSQTWRPPGMRVPGWKVNARAPSVAPPQSRPPAGRSPRPRGGAGGAVPGWAGGRVRSPRAQPGRSRPRRPPPAAPRCRYPNTTHRRSPPSTAPCQRRWSMTPRPRPHCSASTPDGRPSASQTGVAPSSRWTWESEKPR